MRPVCASAIGAGADRQRKEIANYRGKTIGPCPHIAGEI